MELGVKCSTCLYYRQASSPKLTNSAWASHRETTVVNVCLRHNDIEEVKRTGECDDYKLDPTTLLRE